MLFGLAGIGGSILFACKFTQYTKRFILLPIVVIACLLILMQLFSIHPYAIIFLCIVWGMTITIFNLVSQALVIRFAPQATIIAMALFSSIYNIGIGSGSIIGGAVETLTSIHYIGYAGGMIAIIAFIFNKQKIISLLDKQTSKQKIMNKLIPTQRFNIMRLGCLLVLFAFCAVSCSHEKAVKQIRKQTNV